jgi:hypothetical protein
MKKMKYGTICSYWVKLFIFISQAELVVGHFVEGFLGALQIVNLEVIILIFTHFAVLFLLLSIFLQIL